MKHGWLLAFLAAGCTSGDPGSTVEPRALAAKDCTPMAEVVFPIPESPLFVIDPMGPLSDVTCDWQRYQPAEEFCVRLDAVELTPGGRGPESADGDDPECRRSGFGPGDTQLYKVKVPTPPDLCAGCRRLFIDGSGIPENGAHGHVFYTIASFNPTYTIDPIAHSPNTKNFTNDWLVSPPGTPIATVVRITDLYDKSYVTHTTKFAHSGAQGPYYIGPWYVNRGGERIHGVYLDVDVASAANFGNPNLNAMRYVAGFNSGTPACPDNLLGDYSGANFLYAGCADRPGMSALALDPME